MHQNSKLASEFKKSRQKKNCGFSMHSANWNQFQDFLRRENKQKMPALKRNGEKIVHPVPEVFVTEKHVHAMSANLMNVVIILKEKQMGWDKTYSHGLMFNVRAMGK